MKLDGSCTEERRFAAKPTRADAENFALCVASKLSRGLTVQQLCEGFYDEGTWIPICPPAIRCGVMALVKKAEAECGHAFVLEEFADSEGVKHWRLYYDFEDGRLDMAKIRKLGEQAEAQAAGATDSGAKKASAKTKRAKQAADAADAAATDAKAAAHAAKEVVRNAAKEAKEKERAEKAAARAAKKAEREASKGAKRSRANGGERPDVTMVLQRSAGGNFISELLFGDGSYKYFNTRKTLPDLLERERFLHEKHLRIAKVDARLANLTPAEKKELKELGTFA